MEGGSVSCGAAEHHGAWVVAAGARFGQAASVLGSPSFLLSFFCCFQDIQASGGVEEGPEVASSVVELVPPAHTRCWHGMRRHGLQHEPFRVSISCFS